MLLQQLRRDEGSQNEGQVREDEGKRDLYNSIMY